MENPVITEFPIVCNLEEIDMEKLPPYLRAILENIDAADEDIAARFQSSL